MFLTLCPLTHTGGAVLVYGGRPTFCLLTLICSNNVIYRLCEDFEFFEKLTSQKLEQLSILAYKTIDQLQLLEGFLLDISKIRFRSVFLVATSNAESSKLHKHHPLLQGGCSTGRKAWTFLQHLQERGEMAHDYLGQLNNCSGFHFSAKR